MVWPNGQENCYSSYCKTTTKNDAINSVVRIDEDTEFKQAVNVTPTPDKQEQPLSRLKEAMGMANEEVDQAADNVVNNFRKEGN